jgi:hypothetical protein
MQELTKGRREAGKRRDRKGGKKYIPPPLLPEWDLATGENLHVP